MVDHYPVIVIGGGTMGSGTALALARRGVKALVLEQFGHVHSLGSHGGRTRIIRQAYAESPEYVPMVQRADNLWVEIGEETGQTILHRTGGLDIAAPGFDQARSARESAETWDIPFEWLSGSEVNARWPAFQLPADYEACYSPVSGFLEVEPGLRALMALARQAGVEIHEHEPVRDWSANGDGVVVTTDQARYTADRVIITAGAWAGSILAGLGLPLQVRRKTLWWFEMEDRAAVSEEQFPVFICSMPGCGLYAIPMSGDDPGLKAADHDGGESVDPTTIDRTARDEESSHVLAAAQSILKGFTGEIADRSVCMYTMTPDTDFIVDRHPAHEGVILAAGFSGHGFKFAPAMGEHLADLALEESVEPHQHLALERLTMSYA